MFLNRINITNGISSNTPKIVLDEIADSLSIKKETNINRLILKINKYYNKNKIKKDYETDLPSLRIIARYVNCFQKNWKRNDLIKAFQFLCSFEENNNFNNPDFTYGQQTSENIYNLNACVLYRLCKQNLIHIDLNTSMEEMANNLRFYFCMKYNENNLKMEIYKHLKFNTSSSDLINIANILNILNIQTPLIKNNVMKYSNHSKYNYEDYENCAAEILDENKNPKNSLEAIVMAAIYFKIDIRCCENPMYEYELLNKNPYFPYDEKLKQKLREPEDSLENPYINENFKTEFPPSIYNNRDLIYLCGKEGLYIYDETHYSCLQEAYLTETFVHGKQGKIINLENTFLENIKDLEYDRVLSYGIRNEKIFLFFTYAELCDTFSNYKRFINPINNEIFNNEIIEKLYLLTQKDKRKSETNEIYEERVELGEEIERIKIYNSTKDEKIKEFVKLYENLEEENQGNIEKILNSLLNLGMYMRNWDGVGDYPLNVNSTNFSKDKQIVVDHRVTQELIIFQKLVENKLGEKILKLPLMKYHKESNMFVTSNDPGEGLTIGDRIKIVRGGENETMSSCIRMSSNKICASSYYYMVLIGFRLPFNISEIYEIH